MKRIRHDVIAAIVFASLWVGCAGDVQSHLGSVSPLALEVCCSAAPQDVPGVVYSSRSYGNPDDIDIVSRIYISGPIRAFRQGPDYRTELTSGDKADLALGLETLSFAAQSCDFEQATVVIRFEKEFELPLLTLTEREKYTITITNTCYQPPPPSPPPPPPPLPPLVFSSDRDGDLEIYRAEADGSGLVPLTTNSWQDFDPVLSADGTRIAFLSNEHAPGLPAYEIYVMNLDATNRQRKTFLAVPGEISLADPAWSPNGFEIAFAIVSPGAAGIHVLNLVTDVGEQYTFQFGDRSPTWAADSIVIAFDRSGDLYLVNANPVFPNIRPLLLGPTDDRTPAWSSDGTRIAFERGGDLYVMDAFGMNVQPLIETVGTTETSPAWSPDGTRIAYERIPVMGGASQVHSFNLNTLADEPLNSGGAEQEPDWGR